MEQKAPAPKRLDSESKPSPPQMQEETPADRLAVISPEHEPWDVHKLQCDAVSAIYAAVPPDEWGRDIFGRYAKRVRTCCDWLVFRQKEPATAGAAPGLRLHETRSCDFRHCPICQWRRAMGWRARFFQAIPQIVEAHPDARWLLLTLTVRNPEVTRLRATLKMMNLGWNRFVQRQEFAPVLGWVRSTEVTRKEDDGTAHPHFHVLLMVKPSYFRGQNYVSHARWVELWQSSAGLNYPPNVHITVVKPSKGEVVETPVDLLRGAVAETLKYSTKVADLVADAEWLVEMTKQVRGLRFMAAGGVLKDVLKDLRRSNADPEIIPPDDSDDGWRAAFNRPGERQHYYYNRTRSLRITEVMQDRIAEDRERAAGAEKKSAPAFGGNGASGERVSGAAPSAETD